MLYIKRVVCVRLSPERLPGGLLHYADVGLPRMGGQRSRHCLYSRPEQRVRLRDRLN